MEEKWIKWTISKYREKKKLTNWMDLIEKQLPNKSSSTSSMSQVFNVQCSCTMLM